MSRDRGVDAGAAQRVEDPAAGAQRDLALVRQAAGEDEHVRIAAGRRAIRHVRTIHVCHLSPGPECPRRSMPCGPAST